MKILAIGDFHGEFPEKIRKIIKKEKIDIIVSNGDYAPFSLRNEFFKHVYNEPDLELWDVVGKKRYKDTVIHDHKKAELVFQKLNSLSVPVISVFGNSDYKIHEDVTDVKYNKEWKWAWNSYTSLAKTILKYKNIKRFDYDYIKFKDFVFIGARGASFPGHVKSKAYKKHRAILNKLFKRFSFENKSKKVILVSHNSPYNTKLDLITSKEAHEIAKGKHYGSKLIGRIIKRYQPVLSISGHIEEGMGKQKIGKTLAVNVGAMHHGHGAIIEIQDKGKVKVRFLNKLLN